MKKKIVIVGGVAGGASAAARARRLSEEAEIVLLERGPHVSFANCGLPYYVGGEISGKDKLLVQTPRGLQERFRLDVRVLSEVTAIHREERQVEVREVQTGRLYQESYDELILSTGAAPLKPPIPGIDREGHFAIRNVPDVEAITSFLDSRQARRAVVVGGGYVGLEMAEQLRRRGLQLALVEALPQVMAPFDPEMAAWLHNELRSQGVELYLNDAVAAFEPGEGCASVVVLRSGIRLPADVVVLALGVRPEATLARQAGLELGALGGIRVDERMQTSDPHIWAVGDAVEVRNPITDEWVLVPLAGPANRQGRIAAENVLGRDSRYLGTWGTAVLRLFDLTAACTGACAKTLDRAGVPHQAVHLHPNSHAGYYPGATPLALKLLFAPEDGKLLGAQVIGQEGVDKRIDVLATALRAGMTVADLAQLELAYSPPFGSAKDPVNLAGMIAENVLHGDVQLAHWDEVNRLDPAATLLLDVRSLAERRNDQIPGSVHVPLPELRERLQELPRDREIVAYCQSGQRSYYASRILMQNGWRVRNLSGSYLTWKAAQPSAEAVQREASESGVRSRK